MADVSAEPWRWTAEQGLTQLRSGRASAREWMASCLDRVCAVNGHLTALVGVDEEQALAAADRADEAQRRGAGMGPCMAFRPAPSWFRTRLVRPPTRHRRDFATTLPPRTGHRWPTCGATARSCLRGATSPAFPALVFAERAARPHPQSLVANPRPGRIERRRRRGGWLRHGTAGPRIGWGRLRPFPAAVAASWGCVPPWVGFRVSTHRAARRRVGGQLMVAPGMLARTVGDIRLSLPSLAAADARDPWWVPAPLEGPPLPQPIRVAFSRDPTGLGVDPAIADAVGKAASACASCRLTRSRRSSHPSSWRWHRLVPHRLGSSWPAGPGLRALRRSRHAGSHRLVMGYRSFDPVEFRAALARRTTHQRRWALFQQQFPLLLSPAMNAPPFPHGFDVTGPEAVAEMFRILTPMLAAPVLGIPAITLPAGNDGRDAGFRAAACAALSRRHSAGCCRRDRGRPLAGCTPIEPVRAAA